MKKKLQPISDVIRDPAGVDATGERFQSCATCGQVFDTSHESQSFHHTTEGPHDPLPK